MPALATTYDDYDLSDLLDCLTAEVDIADEAPLSWIRWTPPQDQWLRLRPPSGVKLFRAGNQFGKTYAGMAEVIYRATGTHPHYPTKAPPVEIWVVCTSWSQSVAIMTKFWNLCPKDALKAETRDRFRLDVGWGKDNPTALFVCGSIVRFRTTNQGAKALAGSSVHYIHVDEPTTPEVFRELRKRVMRTGGVMGMTLTPVNFDCTWLKKMVAAGTIDEVHAKFDARNFIPIGTDTPLSYEDERTGERILMDQAWVNEQIRITPAAWAPVVLDGEWETAPEGVWFKCFDAKRHVAAVMLDARRGPIHYALGIDYAAGDREYGHVGILVAVQPYKADNGRSREKIVIMDEVSLGGHATSEQFAQEAVSMLERNGLRWNQLSSVHGDNPVTSRFIEKSNVNTKKAMAAELRIPQSALRPPIMNAKESVKSAGSRDAGNQYLYERIASGDLIVHPRAVGFIKSLQTWDYTSMHPGKDHVDAGRYALKPWIFPGGGTSNVTVRLG